MFRKLINKKTTNIEINKQFKKCLSQVNKVNALALINIENLDEEHKKRFLENIRKEEMKEDRLYRELEYTIQFRAREEKK